MPRAVDERHPGMAGANAPRSAVADGHAVFTARGLQAGAAFLGALERTLEEVWQEEHEGGARVAWRRAQKRVRRQSRGT